MTPSTLRPFTVTWVETPKGGHHRIIDRRDGSTVRDYPAVLDPWDWTHYAATHDADTGNHAHEIAVTHAEFERRLEAQRDMTRLTAELLGAQ
jgi:hypothetical protein